MRICKRGVSHTRDYEKLAENQEFQHKKISKFAVKKTFVYYRFREKYVPIMLKQ